MHKRLLVTAAILGFLSVAFGAFGAHTLRERLDAQSLATFETGVRYQFYHVFAIALTAILYPSFPGKKIRMAGNLFLAGTCLFCGSLYLLAFLGTGSFRWIGAITPLGGLAFLTGWFFLGLAVLQRHTS